MASTQTITAIYENGVFTPLEKVRLRKRQKVRVKISPLNRQKRKRVASSRYRVPKPKRAKQVQLARESFGMWKDRQDINDEWLNEIRAESPTLSVAKRGRAALEAQAFLRGTIRARLRRMYPDLSPREITFKYFEEVASNG